MARDETVTNKVRKFQSRISRLYAREDYFIGQLRSLATTIIAGANKICCRSLAGAVGQFAACCLVNLLPLSLAVIALHPLIGKSKSAMDYAALQSAAKAAAEARRAALQEQLSQMKQRLHTDNVQPQLGYASQSMSMSSSVSPYMVTLPYGSVPSGAFSSPARYGIGKFIYAPVYVHIIGQSNGTHLVLLMMS